MIDRADDLCELARDAIIQANALHAIPDTAVEVVCEDDADVDTSEMPPGMMRVYVSWDSYEDAGDASKKESITDYTLVVICVEACAVPGKVPREWRKARTAWIRKCVVDTLGDTRRGKRLDGAYALRVDRLAYSLDELTERKSLWMAAAVTLRDIRPKGA